jgi:hypothetical protein
LTGQLHGRERNEKEESERRWCETEQQQQQLKKGGRDEDEVRSVIVLEKVSSEDTHRLLSSDLPCLDDLLRLCAGAGGQLMLLPVTATSLGTAAAVAEAGEDQKRGSNMLHEREGDLEWARRRPLADLALRTGRGARTSLLPSDGGPDSEETSGSATAVAGESLALRRLPPTGRVPSVERSNIMVRVSEVETVVAVVP